MITLSSLIRWSGMAFIVSGVLLVIVLALHPDIFETTLDRAILDTPWWTSIHVLFFLYAVLAILGVAGLYLAQIEKTGVLGLSGFLMAVVGLIGIANLALVEAFLMPALATDAPATLRWNGPFFASFTYSSAPFGVLWLLGFVLLGIATFRVRIFSRVGALLLAVGIVLTAALEGPFVPFLGIASTVVLAAGQVWLGYDLWRIKSVGLKAERLATGVQYQSDSGHELDRFAHVASAAGPGKEAK